MAEQEAVQKEHSMTWLELLPMEVNQVSELFVPEAELNSEVDKVAGVATEEQKKLFTLYRTMGRELDKRMLEYKYSRAVDEEKKKLMASLSELRQKHEVLRSIFFLTLNDYFNLWGKDSIGVRSGWEVVWSDEKDVPRLRDIFGDTL